MRPEVYRPVALGVIWVASVLACVGFALGLTADNDVDVEPAVEEQPMPCNDEQVYVWDDYPVSAHCVWNQDHRGHAP